MEAKKLSKEEIILNKLYKTCYNFKQAREVYNIIKNDIDKYNMISSNVIMGDTILTILPVFKKGYNIKPVFSHFIKIQGIIIIDEVKKDEHIYTIKTNNADGGYSLHKIKEKNIYKYICFRKIWDKEEIRNFFLNKKMGAVKNV